MDTEEVVSSPVEVLEESAVNRSAQIGKLISALAKAQLEFGAVKKDAENPAYSRGNRRSMYATLDSVIKATREALAKNELVVVALPQEMVDDRRLKITSILAHSSEQFIESTLTMTAVDRVTPQELGKLITYARRYQWTGLTGVAPEDDDDGNASSGVGSREAAQEVAKEKIAELKAKKAQPVPDQLCCYPIAGGTKFEVTGDPAVLQANKELLLHYGKKVPNKDIVTMDAESLEAFKHDFCDERGGLLSYLKGASNG